VEAPLYERWLLPGGGHYVHGLQSSVARDGDHGSIEGNRRSLVEDDADLERDSSHSFGLQDSSMPA
jgi:hypothetical protein